ncbi:MAG TPA: 30S ribosomal protein S13 [Candidatus Nanoarchaeia archaeon]|nr:30S ribosomal protein S13 [Candidatus Nanoarchaeia archaeon]
MAEKQEKQEKPVKKPEKAEKTEKPRRPEPSRIENEMLVRILGFDIPGSKNLYSGLIRIKGISWTIANAACLKLGYPKNKKVADLSKEDIQKIEDFLKALPVYDFLKNRRADPETGQTSHFFGTDLEMKRDFDIKRLRGIKSYRGIRHALKQPTRGQRTRSHFRKTGVAMGVKKK